MWSAKNRYDILHHVLVGVLKKNELVLLPADDYLKERMEEGDIILGTFGWYNAEDDAKLSDCPFLTRKKDATAGCTIYRIRPQACRNFPLKRLKDGKKDLKIEKCPALKEYVKAGGIV